MLENDEKSLISAFEGLCHKPGWFMARSRATMHLPEGSCERGTLHPPKGRFGGGVALFGFRFKSYGPNPMNRRALGLHEHGACSENFFHIKIIFKKIFIATEV